MLRDIQGQATAAMRSLQLAMGDLPVDLRMEAEQLAAELGSDLDMLRNFVEDLLRREYVLAPEDRCAAWCAVGHAAGVFSPS